MVDLSDEQVDFLAKFMGWNRQAINAMAWTGGAVEREAVMDQAVEKGYFLISFDCFVPKKILCEVYKTVDSYGGRWGRIQGWEGKGPTRLIALVNALMEAENG